MKGFLTSPSHPGTARNRALGWPTKNYCSLQPALLLEGEEAVRVNPKVVPQRPSASRHKFLLHKVVDICRKSTLSISVLSVAEEISLNRTVTLKLFKIQQMLNLWYFIALFYLGKEHSFAKILMKKCSFCFWIHWMPMFSSLFLFSVPTVASSSH